MSPPLQKAVRNRLLKALSPDDFSLLQPHLVRFSTVTPTLLGLVGPVVGEALPGRPRPDITLRRATCRDGRERVTPRVGVAVERSSAAA